MTQTHNCGSGSFTSEQWIANKRIFTKLKGVNVEFLTGGQWDWVIANSTGGVVRAVRHDGLGGWTSIDLPSLGSYGNHSIGFRNASLMAKKFRAGDIAYDYRVTLSYAPTSMGITGHLPSGLASAPLFGHQA